MEHDRSLLLAFPDYAEPAARLAQASGLALAQVDVHRFPDGESRVRVPRELPARVILCRSLHDPNHKLIELLLAADAARANGAGHLTLLAPYLCYMRQDKAFVPGEAVSQKIIGRLLAERFDGLITVDPHLHRVQSLREAVPMDRSVALTAAVPMAEFLSERVQAPFLVGPDEESEQWIAPMARTGGFDGVVGRKERLGDAQVTVVLPERGFRGRHVVLVDDVASTGRTLEAAARQLQRAQPASLRVLVTHALFMNDALERLRDTGVAEVWSTDAIPHPTNAVRLAGLLAKALDS